MHRYDLWVNMPLRIDGVLPLLEGLDALMKISARVLFPNPPHLNTQTMPLGVVSVWKWNEYCFYFYCSLFSPEK